jgi:hypothetical protein
MVMPLCAASTTGQHNSSKNNFFILFIFILINNFYPSLSCWRGHTPTRLSTFIVRLYRRGMLRLYPLNRKKGRCRVQQVTVRRRTNPQQPSNQLTIFIRLYRVGVATRQHIYQLLSIHIYYIYKIELHVTNLVTLS